MKNSRVNKWKEYRLEIDSNENLDFSIINSNLELKTMFEHIGFDYKKDFVKSGYKKKILFDEYYKSKNTINQKEINRIINSIEKNEMVQDKHILDFNSHINDSIIKANFREFITDENNLESLTNQETTDLKINQINIMENKEK